MVAKIKYILGAVLIGSIVFFGTHVTYADITTGLQGNWHLDDGSGSVATDSSSNSNNGSLVGAVGEAIQWVTGKINTGIHIAGGTLTGVSIPNVSSNQITGNITVSTWFKYTGDQSASALVAKWGSASGYLLQFNGSNHVIFSVRNSGDTTSYGATASSVYNDGNWHMATGVYDGSHVLLYIDGGNAEAVTGDSYSGTIFNNLTDPLYLGNFSAGSGAFSGTAFDEVCLYNRALSASDVLALYNSPTGCAAGGGGGTVATEDPNNFMTFQ